MHEKIENLENFAKQVRRDIVRMVHAVQSGHPGGSLGCADFITCLYQEIMKHNPNEFSMLELAETILKLTNSKSKLISFKQTTATRISGGCLCW